MTYLVILEESSVPTFVNFPSETSQKRVNLQCITCTTTGIRKLYITTQQSEGTHWEAGVLGWEKQSSLKPPTIYRDTLGLGFSVGLPNKNQHLSLARGSAQRPLYRWELRSPHPPFNVSQSEPNNLI